MEMRLGKSIRRFRKERLLTQEQFSEAPEGTSGAVVKGERQR